MTDASDPGTIRSVLLEVIDNLVSEHKNLQAAGIIQRASRKLPRQQDMQAERALLASFYELFRTGYLSWGHNLSTPRRRFATSPLWADGSSRSAAGTRQTPRATSPTSGAAPSSAPSPPPTRPRPSTPSTRRASRLPW